MFLPCFPITSMPCPGDQGMVETQVPQDPPPCIHTERPKDSPGFPWIFNSSCSRSQNCRGGAFCSFGVFWGYFVTEETWAGTHWSSALKKTVSLGLPLTFIRVWSNGLCLLAGLPGDSPAWLHKGKTSQCLEESKGARRRGGLNLCLCSAVK